MLTTETLIHTPGLIDPNREPWTGTIAEHFTQAGDRAWDKLAAILADHAIDDDLDLDQALEALADAGADDQELASRLTDDPNVIIEDPEEVADAIADALKASKFSTGYSQRADAHVIHGTGFGLYWSLDGECGTFGAEWALWTTDEDGEDVLDLNGLVPYIPGPGAAEQVANGLLEIAASAQARLLRERGRILAAEALSTIRKSLDGADWLPNYGGHRGIGYKGIEFRLGLTGDSEPRIVQTWELADIDEDEDGYGLPDDIVETLEACSSETDVDEENLERQFEQIAAEAIKFLAGLDD